ncbi:hypothetical protein EDD16DRAFT_1626340 [Pisolithus croceorrhizus]|nr:hypothetical protein EDD16DRAFT_1626340 [Pisolithus croceorrhizus]
MEDEISLLMANRTQASTGKLIYDPFIGTGSVAYTTAYFGTLVYGSDIDGRQMRGKDGVSAGAKRLGRKKAREDPQSPQTPRTWIPRYPPYIPPTRLYELSALVVDLILLARYLLKPRDLVFFLPTVTDSYEALDIISHQTRMELVANSLQDFGTWGRRVGRPYLA